MNGKPALLWVLEQGGYPDFSSLYRALGYEVTKVASVRKALTALKRMEPQVVVAEFNYAPTYGARVSPVEPLLARLQSHHPLARVLLFSDPDQVHRLECLRGQYGELSALCYPIQVSELERRVVVR